MFNSVRVRLTLWYTAVLAGVLVALAIASYFVLRENLQHRTDNSLADIAASFLSTVDAELHDTSKFNTVKQGAEAAIAEHHFQDTIFFVMDKDAKAIAVSENPGHGSDRALTHLLNRSTTAVPPSPVFDTVRIDGKRYRVCAKPFLAAGNNYVLVVLQSLHRQEELLETVTSTFAVVIPFAVILASAGGYFLARQSLSPVVAMSTQAGRIGAENLHDRLEVRNPKDELSHLAESFNGLLDRLDQSFERQRRFVADASHELRTPVAILFGESDVALSQECRTPEEYRESLNILRAEAKRLKHIVEDLFTLARADAGQHPLTPSDFYLDELVVECARNMRALASAKRLKLLCDTPGELPINADEALIRRMVLNLLDNAIKYTAEDGTVSVACGESNGSYSLSVSDTGEGIPADLQPRIFERFFRADKVRSRSKSESGGAGLGLAISRWIAESHGGRIELTQSNGAGTTFTVTLPKLQTPR